MMMLSLSLEIGIQFISYLMLEILEENFNRFLDQTELVQPKITNIYDLKELIEVRIESLNL
jgi:hypothetical protein